MLYSPARQFYKEIPFQIMYIKLFVFHFAYEMYLINFYEIKK